ncbi:MAG: lipocalin family protein [Pseudomonadales bacterium]|jgi:apolipoprotein D and lipocalin family protein
MNSVKRLIVIIATLLLVGCTGVPKGLSPVTNFSLERYSGTWYEIARLDHSFERGLVDVTAEYQLNEDGSVRVVNRGFNVDEGAWSEAEGVAYFVADEEAGHLKVSFFRPFYASYVVLDLDPEYQYSIVTGFNRDYLWLLSRTPTITAEERDRFEAFAIKSGFDLTEIIWVEQTKAIGP